MTFRKKIFYCLDLIIILIYFFIGYWLSARAVFNKSKWCMLLMHYFLFTVYTSHRYYNSPFLFQKMTKFIIIIIVTKWIFIQKVYFGIFFMSWNITVILVIKWKYFLHESVANKKTNSFSRIYKDFLLHIFMYSNDM